MMPEMRKAWACPDLGLTKRNGYSLPIPGSREEFPHCPAYGLRLANDKLPAEHLVGGVTHPVSLVAPRALEVENGAISTEHMAPKMAELVHLYIREKQAKFDYESKQRKAAGSG